MGDVAKEGRTVLFVSHNMSAVQSLCDVGIVLNHGNVGIMGPVGEVIHYYHGLLRPVDAAFVKNIRGVQVITIRVAPGSKDLQFAPDSSLVAEMDFYTEYCLSNCYLNLVIEDPDGRFLVHSRTDTFDTWPTFDPGLHRVRAEVPRLGLRAGVYTLWFRLYVNSGDVSEMADSDRVLLEVKGPQVGGLVDVPCHWSWKPIEVSAI
jgi:lipopolysaccharide transport system ATP-binding protein